MESYSACQTEADAPFNGWYHRGKQEIGEGVEVSLMLNGDCVRLGRFALAVFHTEIRCSQLIPNI